MPVSVVPELGALLDGVVVGPVGGRTQTFRYLTYGRHFDIGNWNALAGNDSVLTCRTISNPTVVSDIGSGAAQNVEYVDVYAWWQDGDDLTDPDVYLRAVVNAITARVRTQEKALGLSWYAQVVNSVDATDLLSSAGAQGGAQSGKSIRYQVVLTVKVNAVDVYENLAPYLDLMVNGDFENYPVTPGAPPSWTLQNGVSGNISRGATAFNGVNSIAFTQPAGGQAQSVIQVLPVVAGLAYVLSARYRCSTATGKALLRLTNVTDAVDVDVRGVQGLQSWGYLSIAFTPLAGKVYRVLIAGEATTAGDVVFFDDAAIRRQ